MPRKSAAPQAAAKAGTRAPRTLAAEAKTQASRARSAVKSAAIKPAASKPAASKPAASKPATAKPGLKSAVKAAAKRLAEPALVRARKPAAPAPAPAPARDATRPVLVRDSFTMPEQEYAVLADVKSACLRAGIDVKKSELLRIGVALLGQVDIATLKAVLAALPQLKTGRPPAGD